MSDSSWLWVVFTIIAAAAQTVRNAAQRELTGTLGTVGATHVRFLFGCPFAILILMGVLASGAALPRSITRYNLAGEKEASAPEKFMPTNAIQRLLGEVELGALKTVAGGVKDLVGPDLGALVITHYQRILEYIEPDYVHVFVDGKIVEEGGPELALRLEAEGYEAFIKNYFKRLTETFRLVDVKGPAGFHPAEPSP